MAQAKGGVGQLTIDLGFVGCVLGEYVPDVDRVKCTKTGHVVWVACHKSHCGEPPQCVDTPLDNSKEACERRVEWMRRHKE